jgi:class 3 adenylate cyclase
MKLPQRSFVLSVALSFVVAYGASDVIHFVFESLSAYDDYVRTRDLRIWDELSVDQALLKDREIDTLKRRLLSERKIGDIDYFLLRKNGQTVFFGNGENRADDLRLIDVAYTPDRIVRDESGSVGSTQAGEYLLVVGAKRTVAEYLRQILRSSRAALGFDIGLMSLLVLAIAFHFFKDFKSVIGVFRKRNGDALERLRSSSTREAAIIAEGLSAYQRQFTDARLSEESLRRNVRASVRTELDSGRKPPYQFDAVMVRTDINHYSTLYSTQEVEAFMAVIDELFTRGQAVIERYGGYVTDFVGDEIVYYFKESEHENAAAVALSSIRDIHQIADELDLKTQREFGYSFRVKSAVATGALRFGPQAGGFALSGSVFIETVRILSEIDEKAQNSVYFPARLAPRLGDVCRSEFRKSLSLRGVPGVTELHSVCDFLLGGKAAAAQFFRGDADLCVALERIGAASSLDLARDYIRALGRLGAPSAHPRVHDRYLHVLGGLLDADDGSLGNARRLASVLSLARKLIAVALFDDSLRAQLNRCVGHPDRRVVANAVDALIHFEPSRRNEVIHGMFGTGMFGGTRGFSGPKPAIDNRVLANVLVKQGMVELDGEVINGLRKMIRSSDPLFQASGMYAVGELARFYLRQDLAFFRTQSSFQAVIAEIAVLAARATDERVKHQAAQALAKAQYDTSVTQSAA